VLELSLQIVIIALLIGFNGVLAMSEIALVSSRRTRLQQMADNGDQGARAALSLVQEPTRFLSTIQIGITLVGILAGAFGGANIASRVADWLVDAGLSDGLSNTLGVVIVVVSITYLSLVFGELVPKRIGLRSPERISALIARPMQMLAKAASILVTVLSVSTAGVLRLLGLSGQDEAAVTEEEIRALIGMSAQSGSVAEAEADLLQRVFHFGDRRVHEVMIPRNEAVWIAKNSSVRDFYEVYSQRPHSRFPVFEESQDNVAGILGIKDVLRELAAGRVDADSPIETLLRPAPFVPESKLIVELFREMQASGAQMAIAVDEFGGTAGIVTLEQLLEEMVGQVRDELGLTEPEIQEIDERTRQVDGNLSVEEAREELGIDIPEGPYDTIAGFVLSELGHIPQEGEQVAIDDHAITVAEMRGPKIETLRVTRV
jgi:putative hemolysin